MNNLYDIDCVRPTQFSVIQTIHCNVVLKWFLSFYQNICSLLSLYFIDISQGSVEAHLPCGGICNNHVIADCLQSVPVKKFENRLIIRKDIDKGRVTRFFWPTLYIGPQVFLHCNYKRCGLTPKKVDHTAHPRV